MTHTRASQVGELPRAGDGAPWAFAEMHFQTTYL